MKREILGEKKKSSFDDNLADVVNKIFDNLPDSTGAQEGINKELQNRKFLATHGEDYQQKNVEKWNEFFKEKNFPNITSASMPDIYFTFKTFKRWSETIFPDHDLGDYSYNRLQESISQLKNTFNNGNQLLTSTKLEYFDIPGMHTQCNIVHYAGFKELETKLCQLYFSNRLITALAGSSEGLNFLQFLFDTQDSEKEILGLWSWVGDCKDSEIQIVTPNLSDIPSIKTLNDNVQDLEAYATLRVDIGCVYHLKPRLVIHLEKLPKEEGCGRGVRIS
ncbi:hypothetical protein HZA97_01125 [Candidatus Woesearchaeota archaeon]|nr:hypothetical protein [Candidatus Woesearchaeota archaeon]